MELLDFVQDRFKKHKRTALSQHKPKVEGLQMDWLRSEDLKEEKVITAPVVTITRQKKISLI